jgi:UDP-glucuronate 4-epimerase
MAYYKFTKAILNGDPINVYNNGDMKRDFTYIDDIVEGVVRVMVKIPQVQSDEFTAAEAPYHIYNIGNKNPVTIRDFIASIEEACGITARENLLPMQPGDVPVTFANIDSLVLDVNFKPQTDIKLGINKFVAWYMEENR